MTTETDEAALKQRKTKESKALLENVRRAEEKYGLGKYQLGGKMAVPLAERKYPISPKEIASEYQELAARMNFDGSVYLPRMIKAAFTLDQVKIAVEFNIEPQQIGDILGIPVEQLPKEGEGIQKAQIEAIAKKLNFDKATVEKDVTYMFELGWAFPTRRGWRWARNMMQAKDSQTNLKFDEQLGDEYYDMWYAFQKCEAYPTYYATRYDRIPERTATGRMLFPARKALEMSGIAYKDIPPLNNIEEMLKGRALLAVTNCPCANLVKDRACQKPLEMCIVMDRAAEFFLRRNNARVLTVEETLAIHDMSTEWGAVALPISQTPTSLGNQICHCHWCCCDAFAPRIQFNLPERNPSRSCYQAFIDENKCIGCQTCVTRCNFMAIEMRRGAHADRQEKSKSWTDPDKCHGCGLCVMTCPAGARKLVQVREGAELPKEAAMTGYGAVTQYQDGKHLETGSVMIKPLYGEKRY